MSGPPHALRGGRHGEDRHPWRAYHRRAGGIFEHPRVVHGEGALGQGRRGQPRVPVHSGRSRAERAEDRGPCARLHAVDRRGDDLLRPVQGLHGPGGAAGGRPRHRRYQLAGHPAVGGGCQRGWLPLRGRAPGRGFPGGRVGRSGYGEARRLLPRVRASAGRSPRHRGGPDLPARRQVLPRHGRYLHGRGRRGEALHHGLLRRGHLAHAGRHRGAAQRRARHHVAVVGGAGPHLRGAAHGG